MDYCVHFSYPPHSYKSDIMVVSILIRNVLTVWVIHRYVRCVHRLAGRLGQDVTADWFLVIKFSIPQQQDCESLTLILDICMLSKCPLSWSSRAKFHVLHQIIHYPNHWVSKQSGSAICLNGTWKILADLIFLLDWLASEFLGSTCLWLTGITSTHGQEHYLVYMTQNMWDQMNGTCLSSETLYSLDV